MKSTVVMVLVFLAASGCQCQLTAFHPFVSTAPAPVVTWAPAITMSQYHAQDEFGQASFGYAHPGQAASNFRDIWGNQIGSWAYIDPNGKEVRVSYVADSRGFRVLSNALPVAPQSLDADPLVAPTPVSDTPEVAEAKRAHFAAVAEAKARNAAAIAAAMNDDAKSRRRRSPGRYYTRYHSAPKQATYFPKPVSAPAVVSTHVVAPAPAVEVHAVPAFHSFPAFHTVHAVQAPAAHAVPVVQHEAPVVFHEPVPAVTPFVPAVHVAAPVHQPIISKFHSQDEFGQAAFGHLTADQSASNFRDASGNQMGHYAYINPDGQHIVVYYTAGVDGFRVVSNALPEGPFQSTAGPHLGPAVVQDTPEVAEARRAHLAAVEEARNRARSSS